MNLSNRSNLPPAVMNLIAASAYEAKGDISVTRLIKPPRLVALYKRHSDKITTDAQELAWSVLGQATHAMLERSAGSDLIVEKRLHTEIYGWDVNGQPDVYYPREEMLDDYKVTSVWAFIFTAKEEWESQLNLNAMLHRLLDQPVRQLRIIAFLRDWQMQKALRELKYPQNPIHVVGQVVWDQDRAIEFAEQRVALHQDAQALPDDELPLCTPKERWYRSGGWRVVKNGNKKADRNCATEGEAKKFIEENTPMLKAGRYFLPLEETPGTNMRCLHYCEARSVCKFALSLPRPNEEEGE